MQPDYEQPLLSLVSRVSGEKRSECAVIIPSGTSVELLGKHLSMLAEQDSQDFDIIVIGELPQQLPAGLNVLAYREKYPLGSSGGFGVGRVLAYWLGYKCMINADADCFPASANLVRRLKEIALSEKKMVMPYESLYGRKFAGSLRGKGTNAYGAAAREVLEKSGFEFFRLYRGGEDYEMFERLKMEGLLLGCDDAAVLHKIQMLDYIGLQKIRSNKYIYYKKSSVIARLLLASYALRNGKMQAFAKHAWDAFWEVVKTQLFYSNYPDILEPVYQALFLDMSRASRARTTSLKIENIPQGTPGMRLVFAEDGGQGAIDFSVSPGILGRAHLLGKLCAAVLSKAHYLEPSERFFASRGHLIPLLLLMKPLKYSDGCVYSSGLSSGQAAANAAKAFLLAPLIFTAVASSIVKAFWMDYPARAGNLRKNLEEFARYLEKMEEGAG